MMKQLTTYLFSAILAIYFLMAGMGVNVVTFCCSACAEEGIEHVAAMGCADMHGTTSEETEGCCCHKDKCADTHHKDNTCKFWRVTISDVLMDKCDVQLPNISCVHLLWMEVGSTPSDRFLVYNSVIHSSFSLPYEYWHLEGRTTLSRNCVLII